MFTTGSGLPTEPLYVASPGCSPPRVPLEFRPDVYKRQAYGGSFARWIASDNPQPYNSFGNGSAMRVSPVAWAYDNLDKVLMEAEKTAIAVSYTHLPECSSSSPFVISSCL